MEIPSNSTSTEEGQLEDENSLERPFVSIRQSQCDNRSLLCFSDFENGITSDLFLNSLSVYSRRLMYNVAGKAVPVSIIGVRNLELFY